MNTWHHICKTQSNRSYYVDARTLKTALVLRVSDSVTECQGSGVTQGWSLVQGDPFMGLCWAISQGSLFASQDKWSFSLNTISSPHFLKPRGPLGVLNRRARLGEQRAAVCSCRLNSINKATWGSAVLGRSGAVVLAMGCRALLEAPLGRGSRENAVCCFSWMTLNGSLHFLT